MNFRMLNIVTVALSIAITTPMLAQSQAAPRAGSASNPPVLLGLGTTHHASSPLTARRSVPDAVALGLASAKVYRLASADFPGASSSLVFDENTNTVVGDSSFNGFTLKFGIYQNFNVPGSIEDLLTGINTTGSVVGIYFDFSHNPHGFSDIGGTFTTLDIGGGGQTQPIDINDSGEIVGGFEDASSVFHGFYTLDNGGTYTIFDVPGATSTEAAGVNTAGVISGVWMDATSVNHGFIYSGGIFTSFDFPLAKGTTAIGINDSNEVAGYYTDTAGVNHGFIYSAGSFTSVDVPGATDTQLTR